MSLIKLLNTTWTDYESWIGIVNAIINFLWNSSSGCRINSLSISDDVMILQCCLCIFAKSWHILANWSRIKFILFIIRNRFFLLTVIKFRNLLKVWSRTLSLRIQVLLLLRIFDLTSILVEMNLIHIYSRSKQRFVFLICCSLICNLFIWFKIQRFFNFFFHIDEIYWF